MAKVEGTGNKEERKAPTTGYVNRLIVKATDSKSILKLVDSKDGLVVSSPVNVATALHKLASINKLKRAGRDALIRDKRFDMLLEATVAQAPAFSARSVSDVIWSFATLQHWPPTLLTPMLTSVATTLQKGEEGFEAQHLSTMVWALARLECKPTRLLEQMAELAVAQCDDMNVQNCANLMWGFAKLGFEPTQLLPPLGARLMQPGMLSEAKPVEVADIAFAIGMLSMPEETGDALFEALCQRAAPGAALPDFSSRQLVVLLWCAARIKGAQAAESCPDGLVDAWVAAVRSAHEATPLLAHDQRNLERSLAVMGIDASWVKRSEMLNAWRGASTEGADGGRRQTKTYTDEELRATFDAIDTDKSGDIDTSELSAAIKAIDPTATDATIEQMLDFGDADGNRSVDFDEFKKLLMG